MVQPGSGRFGPIGNLGRMVQLLLDQGKQPILFNVPQVNEAVFPPSVVEEIHGKRDHHNPRLKAFCDQRSIPLADICCLLRNEHFGDELHPNDRGAKIIAEAVFSVLIQPEGQDGQTGSTQGSTEEGFRRYQSC